MSIVKVDYAALFVEADKAGSAAAEAMVPNAVVFQDSDLFGNPRPGGKSYYEADGVCGFAWVKVKPANCGMAKWLKEFKGARIDSYAGGLLFSVRGYGQSMQRKEAYAEAFAKVISAAGIKAYAQSRMD